MTPLADGAASRKKGNRFSNLINVNGTNDPKTSNLVNLLICVGVGGIQ